MFVPCVCVHVFVEDMPGTRLTNQVTNHYKCLALLLDVQQRQRRQRQRQER